MTTMTKEHFYGELKFEFEVTPEERAEILSKLPVPQIANEAKGFNIEDKKPGDRMDAIVLLSSYEKAITTTKKPFLKMTFTNSIGSFNTKMWDNGFLERVIEKLETESVFEIEGKVEEYNGFKSVTIDRIDVYKEDVNPFSLLPTTQCQLEDLTVELYKHLDSLEEPYRTVALKGLEKHWKEFVMKPAAKGHHHNYLGGLLKHTLGLVRIAVYLTKQEKDPYTGMMKLLRLVDIKHNKELWDNLNAEVPKKDFEITWNGGLDHLKSVFGNFSKVKDVELNADLLICAIVYHDMGKIQEYTHAGEDAVQKFKWLYPNADFSSLEERKDAGGIGMDPIGLLNGHMAFGVLMLARVIDEYADGMPIEDIIFLNHCILAHHGKLEWGSNAKMERPEAFLIHFVDYLDSRWERVDPIQ